MAPTKREIDTMKKHLILMSLFLLSLFLLPIKGVVASEHKAYEFPGVKVVPIKDTQSKKQYELYIKLPEKYSEDKNKKYPVIYFTDAVWHIELLSSATFFIMEDVILVGISWQKDIDDDVMQKYGAHFSRFGDYSFKKRTNPKHPKIKFGQAENHLAFIRQDVFKFVESNYRADPANRTYFGFSAGGLFGTYALITQPDTFKNYILGSPSIWKDAPALFAQESAGLKNKQAKLNVLFSHGELEKEFIPYFEKFVSEFKAKNYAAVSSIKEIKVESAGHSDSFPLMGVQSVKWLSSLQPKESK